MNVDRHAGNLEYVQRVGEVIIIGISGPLASVPTQGVSHPFALCQPALRIHIRELERSRNASIILISTAIADLTSLTGTQPYRSFPNDINGIRAQAQHYPLRTI